MFDAIPEVLALHEVKRVMLIGGERALAAAAPGIKASLAGTDVEILGRHVYGKNSTRENIAKIVNSPLAQSADALFAIGGGKAIDTVKTANIELNKKVFSVPTICSNCSAGTAIAVVYNADGSLEGYSYPHCPDHIFINPAIIAALPRSTSGLVSVTRFQSNPRWSMPPVPGTWSIPLLWAWLWRIRVLSRFLPMASRV